MCSDGHRKMQRVRCMWLVKTPPRRRDAVSQVPVMKARVCLCLRMEVESFACEFSLSLVWMCVASYIGSSPAHLCAFGRFWGRNAALPLLLVQVKIPCCEVSVFHLCVTITGHKEHFGPMSGQVPFLITKHKSVFFVAVQVKTTCCEFSAFHLECI